MGSFRRSEFPRSPDDWATFQETYAKANDRRLAWTETEVRGGRFAATLAVPEISSSTILPSSIRRPREKELGLA